MNAVLIRYTLLKIL